MRKEGNAPLFRGRLFLLGQDRPCTQRLKSSLFGERSVMLPTFESSDTSIIECHHFCRINSKGHWKLHCRDQNKAGTSNKKVTNRPLYLEDDYEAAIARNIAVEILKNRQEKSSKKTTTRKTSTSNGPTINTTITDYSKAKKSALDISRTSSNRIAAFPRTTHGEKANAANNAAAAAPSKKASSMANKVAPIQETTLTKLPPNMVAMVEGFLKDLQNEHVGGGQGHHHEKAMSGSDNAIIVDMTEEPPDEISIGLWKLGGHVDLMPAFFHFLSREAIYLVTFDLEQDLMDFVSRREWDALHKEWIEVKTEVTNLDFILGWVNAVHHKTRMNNDYDDFSDDSGKALANVIIVGTNRIGLHPDPRMQESLANLKFETIREALRGHSMENNVCSTYFTVDETEFDCEEGCECQLCQLRLKIYQSFMRLPRMGMRIPESWCTFEKSIQTWMDKGIVYATVQEIFENFEDDDMDAFKSLLELYSDLGLLFYNGSLHNEILNNFVTFVPQSFANFIAQICSPFHFAKLVSL